MSQFYDKSSLTFIPSGYRDGKLYSQKPLSTDGELTFSRGSDIEATRVAANGYIEKAQVNLLLQSNSYDTTWTNTRSTESSGYAGYDGTNDAWKLEEDSNTGTHKIQQSTTTTGVVSASVYAKAAERSALQFLIESGGSYVGANFNLNDGSVQSSFGATFTLIEATSTSVGNGWYRVKFAANVTSSAAFTIYTLDAGFNTSYTGTTGEGIYIQDAQLNYGLVAQTYQETTTAAVVSGITDNMPRLNYDPANPTCPSLLLEPSRQNYVASAEYYGAYTNFGSADTANQLTSPEGVTNATLIVGDGSQPQIYTASPSITLPSAGQYTLSIFAKKGTENYFRLFLDGFAGSSNNGAYFDLVNGTTPTSGASIEAYPNGWYRCAITATIDAGDLTGNFAFNVTPSTSAVFYPSGAVANGKSVYLYGAMLEQGSYKSSYIPTYGASATRTADAASKTGISSLIGQTEGTLFFDFVAVDTSSFQIFEQIRTTGSTNVGQIDIRLQSGIIRALGNDGGVSQFNIVGPSLVAGTRYKCAVRYEANNSAFYINGASVGTDTSCSFTSSSLQQFSFNENAGSFLPSVEINQAILFPTALSNADLAALTSL